jgi:hypothetical protein
VTPEHSQRKPLRRVASHLKGLMFNKKKRILAVAIPVLLTTLAALWSAVLGKIDHPKPYLPYLYVGAVVLLAGVAAYYTQVKPSRDLEKPVLALLGILAAAPLKLGNRHGIMPRVNLMLVERRWTVLGKKRIRMVWGVGMENHPDVRFSCNYDQGVAGRALKTQRPVLDDCETQDKTRFGFSQKQLDQTSHVTAVWSWPVYEANNKGLQTGRVVAVVNFDCRKSGAFKLLSENAAAYEKSLKKFCEVASTVI